ncbi:hypothetical protein BDA96_09G083900 [Sorghum bicolor]|uniref:Uncharacterized protein n=2 Tax=Sorghum bicolor TaxID=4558 RepID=A0A1B6P762_SORBI|nr:hypothetical protein BDA96_09G083900 [Sorghum bicolor]KXG21548.1 hypothetical protein SORBI_3009G079700 [Sorghum bicolor]
MAAPNPYPTLRAMPTMQVLMTPMGYGSSAGGYYGSGGGYGGSGGGYGSGGAYAGYPSTYGSTPPPPQSAYDAPPVTVYGAPPVTVTTGYGTGAVGADGKKNKMGMGLAVGAAAGVLGWLALSGGSSYLEDKFEERLSKRVEENLEREYSYGAALTERATTWATMAIWSLARGAVELGDADSKGIGATISWRIGAQRRATKGRGGHNCRSPRRSVALMGVRQSW